MSGQQTHSSEPWGEFGVPGAHVHAVGKPCDWIEVRPGDDIIAMPLADYERARACVNYCAGVPTENLIKVTAEGGLTRVIDQLTESVRELGKALDAARAEKAGKVAQ